ncbi:TMEM175 family protein [Dokdonella sp.]|uniref:TMEM175 family protein n=1 Tax=Dokdonella sp. TaxID=2291710 RepID=UPI0026175309|nr:TMEM175 family protein [Dokdonella sp.]
MEKGRVEAFSDGVIAVIITIMVLELKPPHMPTWEALRDNWHVFVSYVLSFVYVGLYWNNHHHLFSACRHVNGKVMWANLHFLFWLSLFPFTTAWLNEAEPLPASVPTALYGFVLLMTALSWIPLSRALIACNGGSDSRLARAIGGRGDWKTLASLALYLCALVSAPFAPILSCVIYALVAALWIIPDRRIELEISS